MKSKPAPGFENLYVKSTLSPPTEFERGTEAQVSKLTAEEERLLQKMVDQAKQLLPSSVANDVNKLVEKARRDGLPNELRQLLDIQRSGAPITLTSAVKIIRLVNTMAWNAAKEEVKEEAKAKDSKQGQGQAGPDSKQSGQQGGAGGPGGNGPFNFKMDTNTLILSAFTSYILYKVVMPSEASKDITWQEFNASFLQKGLVEKLVVVNGNRVKVYLHREAVRSQHPDSPAGNENFFYYFTIGSTEGFERRLEVAQDNLRIPTDERIPVSYVQEKSIAGDVLLSLLPTLLLVGGIAYMSRRSGAGGGSSGGIFGMGKSKAKKFNQETDVKVKFADVAGMDEAKVEIMEFVSFLQTPERFQKLGAKIPRGAILSGPPGTGKTLLAKATAGESGVPFFSVSGAEFVEIFVGVGPSRVRDLFANARKNTPCIIFIDESMPSVGPVLARADSAAVTMSVKLP